MSEYIEREALIVEMQHPKIEINDGQDFADWYSHCVRSVTAADVAPVVHGKWLNFTGDFSTAECDQCGELYEVSPDEKPCEDFFSAFKQFYKFCPHCGAKMNAESEESK